MSGERGTDLFGQGTSAGGSAQGTGIGGYMGSGSGAPPGQQYGEFARGAHGGALGFANDYNVIAQQMGGRQAYQPDYSDFQYGQGQARTALDLQQQAAMGNAPSAAEIAGRSAMDRSLANQVAAAGSARGGPTAQASAQRNAQRVNSGNEAAMQQNIQAGRAAEMAQARGQYGQTALAYGGNALGQTGQESANELAQRQLNQQGQEFYNQMGWNTYNQQQQADLSQLAAQQQGAQFGQQQQFQQQQADRNYYTPGGLLGVGNINLSDSRAKQPIGASADRGAVRGRVPDWLERARQEYSYGGTAAHDAEILRKQAGHDRFGVDDLYVRENPYGTPADDIARYEQQSDPALDARQMQFDQAAAQGNIANSNATPPGWLDTYMQPSDEHTKLAYSDANAKAAAYEMGRAHGAQIPGNPVAPQRMPPPPPLPPPPPQGQTQGGWTPYFGNAGVTQMPNRGAQAPGGPALAYSDARAKETARKEGYAEALHNVEILAHRSPEKLDAIARDNYDVSPIAKAMLSRMPPSQQPIRVEAGRAPAPPPPPPPPGGPRAAVSAAPRTLLVKRDAEPGGRFAGVPPPESADFQAAPVTAAGKDESPYPPNELGDRGAGLPPQMAPSDARTKEDANRRMEASFYEYKPEFRPGEQGEHEINYGPMAQSLEQNPITATTVKKDPHGMRMVDMHKLGKVHSGAIAHLQHQIDELRYGGGR